MTSNVGEVIPTPKADIVMPKISLIFVLKAFNLSPLLFTRNVIVELLSIRRVRIERIDQKSSLCKFC